MSKSQPTSLFHERRAIALIAANAIGTGIFTTTGFALRDLGSPWWVLAVWFLGGVYSLLGVYSYSCLHKAYPGSGGEYHFLSRGFHPWLGMFGGLITVTMGFTGPLAGGCVAFASYFLQATQWQLPVTIVALAALLLVFLVHWISLHKGLWIHDLSVTTKIFLFAVVVLAAFLCADWRLPKSPNDFSAPAFAGSFFWIAYAFSGWNSVYYVVSEWTTDNRAITKASFKGTAYVFAMYMLLNIPLLFGTDPTNLSGTIDVVAVYFHSTTGFGVDRWISALIAIGLLSTISSFLVIVPRIYSRMAEDKVLPKFFYFSSGEHPQRVLVFQFFFTAVVLVFVSFERLLQTVGFMLTLCSFISVCALLRARSLKTPYQWVFVLSYLSLTGLLIALSLKSVLG